MTTQQSAPVGYGGYEREELHVIVQRAHRERAEAVREMFAWLFSRHKAAPEQPRQSAHLDAVVCS